MKFERERTQPSKDLISRIADMSFSRILDLGCGPGNSTFAPKSKFTKSEIIGIDASKNMLLSWLGSIEQKPKVVFVNHGHDTVCDEFAKSIENAENVFYSTNIKNQSTVAKSHRCFDFNSYCFSRNHIFALNYCYPYTQNILVRQRGLFHFQQNRYLQNIQHRLKVHPR